MLFLFFFTEKWMTKSYNPNKLSCIPGRILDIFLLSLCVMSVFPLFCVPIYLNNMNLPILLPSILPQAEEHELWDFALKQNYLVNFVFGSVIIVGSLWVGQLFLALSIFCFLYTLSVLSLINDEFRVPLIATSKPSSNTISLLRTVRHLPKEYNCVQLLHKDANGIIRYMIPILQSEFLQFILSCNVILIRNWTSMDIYAKAQLLTWSFTFQFGWTMGLEVVGRYAKMSKTTLMSWKNLHSVSKHEKKCFTKYAKTCQPLAFGAGGVFTVNRRTVLKFIRSTVKGTFKALLAIGRR
ncbi:uncharacterized protein LOC118435745 [Folsomia candida]|uniref:uncharacterized protein LOC118435745 n=1 Tax=Folsomia candida TaxID=158441 RepID=UPI0016052F5F|nr:uncharacterized protein LOC118435745 [Folsomia candida]